MNEPVTSSRRTSVHMIGNAHIDHAWLWRWAEARAEVLATCRSALDRMREFPEFVFSFSSSVSYEWIEQDDPGMFDEIRQRIAEGRWNIVGGWYVQPDCNLPHGESFVRQAIYGKQYFRDRFGVDVKVGYNVDSFGHANTLPMLLAGAGFDSYAFFRPKPNEKSLPDGAFWWQSPDGSRVLTCRPPLHYNSREFEIADRVREAIDESTSSADSGHVMCFYGVGNHGGGPTIRNIESIIASRASLPQADVLFSTPDAYFAGVRDSVDVAGLPIVDDELQYHSVGCYSALSSIKRWNRAAEHQIMAAERLATIAAGFGSPYPRARLDEAWKLILFNQFHDTMAGTCIPEVYDDCRTDYARVADIAEEVVTRSIEGIAKPERDGETADRLVVANALPWARSGPVGFTISTRMSQSRLLGGVRRPVEVRLTDETGAVVPTQVLGVSHSGAGYRVDCVANLELPGLGYRSLNIEFRDEAAVAAEESGRPTEVDRGYPADPAYFELRNEHLTARIDRRTGWLTSLVDLATGVETINGAAAVPIVIDDPSDTWSHDVAAFRDELARLQADADVRVTSTGPIRRSVTATCRYGDTTVVQEFSLDEGSRQLNVDVRVDWHEQWRALKLSFPLTVREAVAVSESPYGSVTRPTNGHEEFTQSWVALAGRLATASGDVAGSVALLNDGKYGYDALGSDLRLTVLRSPAFAFHTPRVVEPRVAYTFIDQGTQEFRYALAPRVGPNAGDDVPRQAWEFNEPVVARPVAGSECRSRGFVSVDPVTVVPAVVKRTESGDDIVVRLHETAGRTTRAQLTFSEFGDDGTRVVDMAPHTVVTVTWRNGELVRTDLLEVVKLQPSRT